MKKYRKEGSFLEQLMRVPNVSLACEKVGLARNTVYRWRKEDPDFQARMDEALTTGVNSVNDLAESKLVGHINNGSMRAIEYWLDNHKKEYVRPRPKNLKGNTPRPVHTIIVTKVDEKRMEKHRKELRKQGIKVPEDDKK